MEWQEVLHRGNDGEKHVADVKTKSGWVVEFQHSYLRAEERRAREAFYGRMFWVVNGLRLKRDKPNFYKALRGPIIGHKPLRYSVSSDECSIFRRWTESRVAVLFDFGETPEDINRFSAPVLWRLDAASPNGLSYLCPMDRAEFVERLRAGAECANLAVKVIVNPGLVLTRPLRGFERYLAYQRRARSRIRF